MKNMFKCYWIALLFVPWFGQVKGQCWELVWEDQFNYTGLPDPAKWDYDVGGDGWGNNELQYYTRDRVENARVEDGKLVITAIKENFENRGFTSARLVSRQKGDWLYGRVEVSAKLPTGRGTWPAIWMLPTDWEYGGWPASGEIDVMEHVGYDQNVVHGTVHTEAYNHMRGTQVGQSKTVPEASNSFHVYAVEWYEDRIDFFIDDDKYFTFENQNRTFAEWPFDKRFHLLLNIAIGGDWGGAQGIDPELNEAVMEVEYVKVFQKGEDMEIEGLGTLNKFEYGAVFKAPFSEDFTYVWEVPEGASISGPDNQANVVVNWGCDPGKIVCHVSGKCGTYILEKSIHTSNYQISGPMFFSPNEELIFYTTRLVNTTFDWQVPDGVEIMDGQGTNEVKLKWGQSQGNVILDISNSCGAESLSFKVYPKGQWPYPDPAIPHSIPGTINATHYDYGGQGVSYNDRNAHNEGNGPRQDEGVDTEFSDNGIANVGWVESGEWIEFTVNVGAEGYYHAFLRTASEGNPDHVSILIDGNIKYGPVKVNHTGSWDSFVDLDLGVAYLKEGEYKMRYDFGLGGYNVGNMTFAVTTDLNKRLDEKINVYPNPSSGKFYLTGLNEISYLSVIDVSGRRRTLKFLDEGNYALVDLKDFPSGIYILEAGYNKDLVTRKRLVKK